MNDAHRVAIFGITPNVLSETFIRNHVVGLRLPVLEFYGKEWNLVDGNGSFVFSMLLRAIGEGLRTYGLHRASYRVWCLLLSRYLARRKVTHILAEFGVTGSYLYKVARMANIPITVHFFGYDAFAVSILNYYHTFYVEMFSSSKAIIAVSNSMARQLVSLGAPKNKVINIPCGVDTLRIKSYSFKHAMSNKFIGYARFVEKKGQHLTILAFSKILKEFPDASLGFIGAGPLLGPCRRLVKALGLNDAVTFHGPLRWTDAICLVAKHDIFLQHSVVAENGDREGTPVALLEAQVLGLPCVASRHEGIAEAVTHGVNGLLCEEGNVDQMSILMLELLRDRSLYNRLSENARLEVCSNYELDIQLPKLRSAIID